MYYIAQKNKSGKYELIRFRIGEKDEASSCSTLEEALKEYEICAKLYGISNVLLLKKIDVEVEITAKLHPLEKEP